MELKKIFATLLFLSPIFVWLVFHPHDLWSTIKDGPENMTAKVQSVPNPEQKSYVEELRWRTGLAYDNQQVGRIHFNKFLVYSDEIFSFLSNFSPRIYFQAGDGTGLSPPGTEPLPMLLFPFWLYGFYLIIKEKNYKVFLLGLMAGTIAYLFGRRSIVYLSPVLILYLYLATLGISKIKNRKYQTAIVKIVSLYSLFLILRILWLNY